MATDGNWSPKQEALILAYSMPPYPTLKDAAADAGVGERTAHRWWHEVAGFADACAQERAQVQADVRAAIKDRMHEVLPEMFDIKVGLARTGLAKRDEVRDTAATWILEYALGKAPARTEQRIVDKDGEDREFDSLMATPVVIQITSDSNPFDQ